MVDDLYPIKEVIVDKRLVYEYYKNVSKKPIKNTKWEIRLKEFVRLFKKYNIRLRNKNCLDISGGPRFLIKHLSRYCKKAMVTEFNPKAVSAMRKNLKIQAYVFDYNRHDISQVVKGKFDLIIIDYSVNFCRNLESFVSSLSRLIKQKGTIFISFTSPTLGCYFRWQYNDYPYEVLHHPNYVLNVFPRNGFCVVDRLISNEYHFLKGYRLLRKLYLSPFFFWYSIKSLFTNKVGNRELVQ
jgi:2-polyprenyl-3-methyl-5-hydroxy-6-metoxy-1,4-benzoquinol methylase